MRLLFVLVLLSAGCGAAPRAEHGELGSAWSFEIVHESRDPDGGAPAPATTVSFRRAPDGTFAWREDGDWNVLADPFDVPARVAAIDWDTLSATEEEETAGGALDVYRLVRRGGTVEVRRRNGAERSLRAAQRELLRVIAAVRAARTAPPAPHLTQHVDGVRELGTEGAQGVSGHVLIVAGDRMPPFEGGRGAPAAGAPVHVLRGAHAPMATLDLGSADYVGSATTDAEGAFRIALPAGTYTVLTEHGGQPYLNSFDGEGRWGTIQITAGQWGSFDIVDSAGARY